MNKTLKKTLSIILTILMIVTAVPFAFAAGDGTPLTIDLSEVTASYIYIGNGYTYYDEDGYIITGTNTNVTIQIYDSCDITFSDMSAKAVDLYSSLENVTVTLDGDNYLDGYGFIFSSTHLTINGDDDDTLTIESSSFAFTTSGNPGSLTVNGGKINAVTETTSNYTTIHCSGGFILNGGEVTASNNYYPVIANKTVINGGTLNVISTSPNQVAIIEDVEIAKGALLTVSATYKVIRDTRNITPINEAEENLLFFARFDTDIDFAIVSDIKAAIEDKTYAEIKVDAHEHDLDNNGKCICGYECPHTETEVHLCKICGITTECADKNSDHKCDICEETLSECADKNSDHKCDICEETLSECADENEDHKCDICEETLSECADENSDHQCDICGTTSECADENEDHKCDICEEALSECADENSDHKCDICEETISECADENSDNICDICGVLIGVPNIYVVGIFMNGDNYTDILGDADDGATAYYIPETKTLVLDGFVYEGEGYGIECDGSLNIEIKGENKIVANYGLKFVTGNDAVINIGGTGKLDIEAIDNGIHANSVNDNDANIEINVKDSVTLNVDSADDGVDIDSNNDIKLTVSENGALNIKAVSEGIIMSGDSESVEILVKDNGALTIDGEDECINIDSTNKAAVTFTDNAKVSIKNNDEEGIYISAYESGTVTVSGNADVYIDADEEGIEAATVIVDGGSLKAYGSSGYPGILVDTVTVSAGKVIAKGEDENAITANAIKITDGTLVASNNTKEYPVFSVTPDFSEYTAEHSVLASKNADSAYLVEYDSDNVEDYRIITIQCKHELDGKVCKKCGFECGVDCGHYLAGWICSICGKRVYAITHQPTAAEPYVELNDETDATYQWYTVECDMTEITDENAKESIGTYSEINGWVPMIGDSSSTQYYFSVDLKAGDEVNFEFSSAPGMIDFDGDIIYLNENVYTYVAEEDGTYELLAYYDGTEITARAYFSQPAYTSVDGETASELKTPEFGKKYACEVTYGDGKKEMSDIFEYVYAIAHQPTEAEPYVELNDDTDASYQWYKVEEKITDITDENASTVSYDWGESSYDKETGWTGVPFEEGYSGQDFFTVALEAGETVVIEVTGDFANGVGLYDYDTGEDIWVDYIEGVTSYELTVESEGNYTFYTYVNSGVVTVKATVTKTTYTKVEGQTSATLIPTELGDHACEVTFADGTKEMSDIFEVTHICDFSGEWKSDRSKHWKECSCGDIAEESTHSWNFGKCTVCEYACKHSFTKYAETEAPRCGVAGKEAAGCNNGCGAMNQREIPALTHKENNGDYKCDNGCGHEFEKPAEPDTPDEPSDGDCDHLCHKDGFMGFIWKIIRFFQKLFRIQQYCDCGELHYEKAIFG